MNRHQKKVISLAAGIANLSLTCAVAGVATYAWFTTIEKATSTGISITTPTKHIHLDYVILKYDDELKQGKAGGLSDPTEFVLPQYDEYIKERNKYCNLIVRANLVFAEPIDTSKTEIRIDITKLEDSVLKAADPEDNNKLKIQELTSNVVQFKSVVTSYTLASTSTSIPIDVGIQETAGSYATEADAMYRTAIEYFANEHTPTTFISLMNGQPVDPLNGNMITLVPELYNVGVVKGAVVYLECSYNEQLVEGFVKDHPEGGLSNLSGDIDLINFTVHDFAESSFGAVATGKYHHMNSTGASYDGHYLDSYITNSNQQILDGTKTTGEEDVEEVGGSGINVNNNQKSLSGFIVPNKDTVYAARSINDSSFEFNRSLGTFKSKNGHYIGNDSPVDGIVSRSDDSDMRNTLSYSGTNNYDANITSLAEDTMQLQYKESDSKFAYYGSDVNQSNEISLYRYHENDPIDATLTGFTLTTSENDSDFTYSLGEYFTLKGVNCVATYTRSNPQGEGNITFTINVTNLCTYVMDGDTELTPEKTSFNSAGPKTVTVTYEDRGVTFSDTYSLLIISDMLTELTVTHSPAKVLYRVGEALDVSDLVVMGQFAVAGEIAVQPTEYQLKIGNTIVANGSILGAALAAETVTVVVDYTGGAVKAAGLVLPSFTIKIVDYVIQITNKPETLDVNDSVTINFTYNAPLTWTITGTAGALSFSNLNSTTTSGTTPYSGSNYGAVSGSIVIYGKDNGYATVTATITGHTSYSDSFTITVGDPLPEVIFVSGTDIDPDATGSGHQGTITKDYITMHGSSTNMSTNYTYYRFYKNSTLTFSSTLHTIKGIEFTLVNGSDGNPANLSTSNGTYDSTTATWSGSSRNITFDLAAAVFAIQIKVIYEEGVIPYASELKFFEEQECIHEIVATHSLTGGSVGDVWTPIAKVYYLDGTNDTNVTWSKSNESVAGAITLNNQTGAITINKVSGSVTITATSAENNSSGNPLVESFTLSWSNFTKKLTGIVATPTEATSTFALHAQFVRATITASYNDGSTQDVTSLASFSSPDMDHDGIYTVNVSYSETYGQATVTKETSYSITVGTPPVITEKDFTIDFGASGNCQATSQAFDELEFESSQSSGSNAPFYSTSSHDLRLYADTTNGNGNTVTLTPYTNCVIKKVIINAAGSSYTPPVIYNVDSGSDTNGVWDGTSMTISNLNCTGSFVFRNAITGDSTQLRISSIVLTLQLNGTVVPPSPTVSSVTLNNSTLALDLNGPTTGTLTATVNGTNHPSQSVTWTTSDPSVATVSNGTVTAVGVGNCTIRATSDEDDNYYAECTVSVTNNTPPAGSDVAVDLSQGQYANSTITWTVMDGTTHVCTILQEKYNGGTAPNSSYISNPRWYSGNKITITIPQGRTITKIVVVATSASYATAFADSNFGGVGSCTASGTTATWTGTATGSLVIIMGGQCRISSITITYS